MSIDTRILHADDCLNVLNDEIALPSASVDLIYLDPPFNSKSTYNLPFKGKYKRAKPVEAFTDTWAWGDKQDGYLEDLHDGGPHKERLAEIVTLAQRIVDKSRGPSLSAYLINMAVRLIPMKRVLKDTGSIYLHCDPTASHYLKLVLDAIFGKSNFQNEIIWYYKNASRGKRRLARSHDVIFWYTKTNKFVFNRDDILVPFESDMTEWRYKKGGQAGKKMPERETPDDVITLSSLNAMDRERTGYPTQKPLSLLKPLILASSNKGDTILDPFCGCGTTVHTAEELKRNWIGIDISNFATGLVRERLVNYFAKLNAADIATYGVPHDIRSAQELARRDKFEFEKWVCGAIGAHGMFHDPGGKGPDGGVDGVIEFGLFKGLEQKIEKSFAIVQVKGGKVTPDSVRALDATMKRFGASAGVLVCFDRYMKTVENNRSKGTFKDLTGEYQIVQGFSIEQLLNSEKPKLPPLTIRKDARLKGDVLELI